MQAAASSLIPLATSLRPALFTPSRPFAFYGKAVQNKTYVSSGRGCKQLVQVLNDMGRAFVRSWYGVKRFLCPREGESDFCESMAR